jgi:aminoglycoside 3-N-acetyltransferase
MMDWAKNDFSQSLKKIGIADGDSILVHSNIGLLGMPDPILSPALAILESLNFALGKDGNLFLPAFTYSFGVGKVYDITSSDGIKDMGLLSMSAFNSSYLRTRDPMFSILMNGSQSPTILAIAENCSNGPGSVFDMLLNMNVKILSINMGVGTTLIHEIEFRNNVNYRYMKDFYGQVKDESSGALLRSKWKSFVRNLEIRGSEANFKRLNKDFSLSKYWNTTSIGKGYIGTYRISDMESFLEKKFKENTNYLTNIS